MNLADYMKAQENGRENLGAELPVAVYRLLEYSIREELASRFGKEKQIRFSGAQVFGRGHILQKNIWIPL